MSDHRLPTALLQAVVNYLRAQPYGDVVALMDGLREHAREIPSEPPPSATPTSDVG